jgi:hypothetical protein
MVCVEREAKINNNCIHHRHARHSQLPDVVKQGPISRGSVRGADLFQPQIAFSLLLYSYCEVWCAGSALKKGMVLIEQLFVSLFLEGAVKSGRLVDFSCCMGVYDAREGCFFRGGRKSN